MGSCWIGFRRCVRAPSESKPGMMIALPASWSQPSTMRRRISLLPASADFWPPSMVPAARRLRVLPKQRAGICALQARCSPSMGETPGRLRAISASVTIWENTLGLGLIRPARMLPARSGNAREINCPASEPRRTETMRLLVTRPRDDAEAFAALLRARGHEAVVAPIMEVHAISGPPFSCEGVQGVLATSANGVRALAARTARRDVTVYA